MSGGAGGNSRPPGGTHLGMVDRYVTSRLRSSCFIRSWLVLAGKVRIGPPRLSLPPGEQLGQTKPEGGGGGERAASVRRAPHLKRRPLFL